MRVNGTKIKKLRGERSAESLAVSLDIKIRRLYQIESSDRIRMNLNVAKAAAKFLGVKLSEIAAE